MNNPAASGRGIEIDLLVDLCSTSQGFNSSPQGAGNSTPTRLKVIPILSNWGKTLIFRWLKRRRYVQNSQSLVVQKTRENFMERVSSQNYLY
jgi:hypothetical protein